MPAKVTRYQTTLSTKDCGLGDDFFKVLQEAAAKFPGIDLSGGSDQLVLFVPPGVLRAAARSARAPSATASPPGEP